MSKNDWPIWQRQEPCGKASKYSEVSRWNIQTSGGYSRRRKFFFRGMNNVRSRLAMTCVIQEAVFVMQVMQLYTEAGQKPAPMNSVVAGAKYCYYWRLTCGLRRNYLQAEKLGGTPIR